VPGPVVEVEAGEVVPTACCEGDERAELDTEVPAPGLASDAAGALL